MVDLQGRLVLQSNIAALTKEIETGLKGIKGGSLALFSKSTVDRAKAVTGYLSQISTGLHKIRPNIEAVAKAFKDMSSAITSANSSIVKNSSVIKTAGSTHHESAEAVKKHMSVMAQFGDQAGIAAKRYTAFTIAVGLGFGAIGATSAALKESIQFQDKLVKMSQVSGKSLAGLKPLTQEISKLSTTLGVSSDKLADVSLTLLQAGYNSRDVKKSLEALAKVELAPSFGNIEKATEAAIAIMSQFGTNADQLKGQLSSINKVSAEFAVEASDIVVAIQRAGSAFGQLAKDTANPKDALNEFIALFTSVRATTRESAETIATGLRTIFTRLQRPSTIQFFKNLKVELQDVNGRFIGLYPAISRISDAIKGIPFTDPRIAAIGEELGGFRQINKTIPLLTQLERAQEALNVAKGAGANLDEVAAQAGQSLAVSLNKVHESFLALFRDIQETGTFQALAHTFLVLANGAIQFANAMKPLIPLITAWAGAKLILGATEFLPAFKNRIMGTVPGRASGGVIPGIGNGDTQPIMATPGEFMIKKSSAQKIGYQNLHRLNKYAKGGIIGMASGGTVPSFITPSEQVAGKSAEALIKKELEAIKHVFGDLLKDFKVVFKDNITGGKGQSLRGAFDPKTKQILIDPTRATSKTIAHEVAHAVDFALGGGKYSSKTQGTPANKAATRQFYLKGVGDSIGKGQDYQTYRMTPQELFAHGMGSTSASNRATVYSTMQYSNARMKSLIAGQTDAYRAAGGGFVQPKGMYGPHRPSHHVDYTQAILSQGASSLYSGGTPRVLTSNTSVDRGSIHSRLSFGNPINPTINSSRGGTNNWKSSILRSGLFSGGGGIGPFGMKGGSIRHGLGRGIGKLGELASGNGVPIGAVLGAVGAQQAFGTVADNKPGHRRQGAVGDVVAGTLGGVATGAAFGGAPGAAVGALVGFTFSLHQATEELKRFNLNDAIEEGLEEQKQGRTVNFSKIQRMTDEATNPGFLDYIKNPNIGVFGNPFSKYEETRSRLKQERAEQFGKEHEGDLKALFAPELSKTGKKFGGIGAFNASKEGQELRKRIQDAMPHLTGEQQSRFIQKGTGLIGTNKNFNKSLDSIDAMIVKISDLADAMKSANVATQGLTDVLDLNLDMASGRVGLGKFADRSDLIRNPNRATFGETAKELDGLPDEVGFAAYTQANIRKLAENTYNNGISLENDSTIEMSLSKALDKMEKDAAGFGIKSTGRTDIETLLLNSVKEGGKVGNFHEFAKKFENPMKEILGPAADIQREKTARKNDYLSAVSRANEGGISAIRGRFGQAGTGIELHNRALEFSGHTQGSLNTMGAFQRMQGNLAGGIGMNPNAIGARLAQIQGLRNGGGLSAQAMGNLNTEFQLLSAALENLTHSTDQNTAIEKQLAEINANRGERVGLGKELLTANPAQRAEIIRGLHLVNAYRGGAYNPINHGPEDNKLLFDTVGKMGNVFSGLNEQLENDILSKLGIGGNLGVQRAELQGGILGNINNQGVAQGVQAGLQEGAANAASIQASERFGAVMAPLFDNFNKRFERAVAMMPHEIQLKSEPIQLNVNINGAEALAKLQPEFEAFVATRIQEGLTKFAGKLREKPPNGPGLPLQGMGF